jgi:hypothetical protein
LNLDEKFVTTASMSCASGTPSASRCTTDLGVVGSYVVVDSISVAGFGLTPPAGYPSSRYKIVADSVGSVTPATGLLRFSQATTATATFRLSVATVTNYREIQFRRSVGGAITIVSETPRTRFQSVFGDTGVVGTTR